jgi:hypothetical protein
MKVKQIVSGVESDLSKEEYEKLQKSGHARNLEVIDESGDYQPSELAMPTATAKDKTAKSGDAKSGDEAKA